MKLYAKFSENKVRQSILQQVKKTYRKSYPTIKKEIKKLLEEKIRKSFDDNETVQAIRNGELTQQLGLENPYAKIISIRNAIIEGIQVNIKADTGNALLTINIQVGEKDFSDILELDAAFQNWTDAQGTTIKGPPLPWLDWLLLKGTNNIIDDYRFSTGGVGRTGLDGIMKKKEGSVFKIPDAHSGIESDNFITKIFDEVSKEIDKKLWQTVRPVLTRNF